MKLKPTHAINHASASGHVSALTRKTGSVAQATSFNQQYKNIQ
jgi:hypothetical protein